MSHWEENEFAGKIVVFEKSRIINYNSKKYILLILRISPYIAKMMHDFAGREFESMPPAPRTQMFLLDKYIKEELKQLIYLKSASKHLKLFK